LTSLRTVPPRKAGSLPDKPEHVIEIPESLGRDVDKAREGKLKGDLPIEAFMSDAALEQVDRQTQAAATPVHAEDLTPISKADAAQRTIIPRGGPLPSMPSTRRVIPAPFRRPRIDISHHGRSWQLCRADEIAAGDTVPDVGLVASAQIVTRYETVAGVPDVAIGMKVILRGVSGTELAFDPGQQVRAHRKAE
jgi:hypothetical protein